MSGIHATRVGVFVSAVAKSSGDSFWGLVEENITWQRSVIACKRYVDISVRTIGSIYESNDGRGRESRCKRSAFLETELFVRVE
jgi:hypothetical protein